MERVGKDYLENHYCADCLKTNPFLSTGRVVSFSGNQYVVMVCIICTKYLWRLASIQGRLVMKEVSDG